MNHQVTFSIISRCALLLLSNAPKSPPPNRYYSSMHCANDC